MFFWILTFIFALSVTTQWYFLHTFYTQFIFSLWSIVSLIREYLCCFSIFKRGDHISSVFAWNSVVHWLKKTHNEFSRPLESYHLSKIHSVLNDLAMLGFLQNISIPDFHGDPCSCLSVLLLTAAMVMPVIDRFLESPATQQFYNCIINNSINCSSSHLALIY